MKLLYFLNEHYYRVKSSSPHSLISPSAMTGNKILRGTHLSLLFRPRIKRTQVPHRLLVDAGLLPHLLHAQERRMKVIGIEAGQIITVYDAKPMMRLRIVGEQSVTDIGGTRRHLAVLRAVEFDGVYDFGLACLVVGTDKLCKLSHLGLVDANAEFEQMREVAGFPVRPIDVWNLLPRAHSIKVILDMLHLRNFIALYWLFTDRKAKFGHCGGRKST